MLKLIFLYSKRTINSKSNAYALKVQAAVGHVLQTKLFSVNIAKFLRTPVKFRLKAMTQNLQICIMHIIDKLTC